MTLPAFSASASCSISSKTGGTICQDRPYLSLSQPHCTSAPPSVSFSQNSSISSCVSQLTTSDTASVNLKCGPPFKAMNSCPSSRNLTVITVPACFPVMSSPSAG